MIFEGTPKEYAKVISHFIEIPLLRESSDIDLICNQAISQYVDRRVALFIHSGNMVRGSKTPKDSQQRFKAQLNMSITDAVIDHLNQRIKLWKLELII